MLAHAIHDMPTIQKRWETPALSSLLLPKLLPPRLPSLLVARPRLLQRLDVALERKITLLVAPAGFGKTTLVNQWINACRAHGRPKPVAWISLDSGDNDLFRFWRYVIAACQIFQEDVGQTALASLSDALQPPFASSTLEIALSLLLNDLAQHVQDGLLVLDDFHLIEELRILKTLTFFLDHLPPTLSVLLVTRTEPLHLPLLRWRASGDLSELHTADLRFSLQETATFARQTLPTPLSDAALKQLDTFLRGWVAGLRLLTLTLPEQMLCWLAALSLQIYQEEAPMSTAESPRVEALLHMAEEGWQRQNKPAFLGLIAALRAMHA